MAGTHDQVRNGYRPTVRRTPPPDSGGRLRWWRMHRGLTQAQLAARTFVDRTTLSKLENNRVKRLDPEVIAALAIALDVDSTDLLPALSLTDLTPEQSLRLVPPGRGHRAQTARRDTPSQHRPALAG